MIPPHTTAPSTNSMTITELYRYAVKGLSGDSLERIPLHPTDRRFPDDRRYALLFDDDDGDDHSDTDNNSSNKVKAGQEWLHKQNFLCAFTRPEWLAQYKSEYHSSSGRLTLQTRKDDTILVDADLSSAAGRSDLANYMSEASGTPVTCVESPTFHFGNTRSGIQSDRKDSRVVHLVNQATIDQVAEALNVPLWPSRFRPNLVVQGIPAWSEFDWVDDNAILEQQGSNTRVRLTVLRRTVRCAGISVDPAHDPSRVLDMPALLTEHFPEHGPYLGIYAAMDVVTNSDACHDDTIGALSIGDELRVLDKVDWN